MTSRFIADVDLIAVETNLIADSSLSLVSIDHIVIIKLDLNKSIAGLEIHNPRPCKGIPEAPTDLPLARGNLRWVPGLNHQDIWEANVSADYYLDSGECVVTLEGQVPCWQMELAESVVILLTSSQELAGLRVGRIKNEHRMDFDNGSR